MQSLSHSDITHWKWGNSRNLLIWYAFKLYYKVIFVHCEWIWSLLEYEPSLFYFKFILLLVKVVPGSVCEMCLNTEFFQVRIWALFTQLVIHPPRGNIPIHYQIIKLDFSINYKIIFNFPWRISIKNANNKSAENCKFVGIY